MMQSSSTIPEFWVLHLKNLEFQTLCFLHSVLTLKNKKEEQLKKHPRIQPVQKCTLCVHSEQIFCTDRVMLYSFSTSTVFDTHTVSNTVEVLKEVFLFPTKEGK